MKKNILLLMAAALCFIMIAGASAEGEKVYADQFSFTLAQDETLMIENTLFSEDVTISGDAGQIIFSDCEFKGDVVHASNQPIKVILFDNNVCGGNLVFKNDIKEATFDDPFPKFILCSSIPAVIEEGIGCIIALGTFDMQLNGKTYALTDAELFYDGTKPENGMVPYEGQEANCYVVAQWQENGEKKILVECEYDPTM